MDVSATTAYKLEGLPSSSTTGDSLSLLTRKSTCHTLVKLTVVLNAARSSTSLKMKGDASWNRTRGGKVGYDLTALVVCWTGPLP